MQTVWHYTTFVNPNGVQMVVGAWDSQRMVFQQLIRELRKEAGLTQSDLAELLKKPQSYVSKYESGERRLDVIELREVCDKCNSTLVSFSRRLEAALKE